LKDPSIVESTPLHARTPGRTHARTHLEEDGEHHGDAVHDVALLGAPALLELCDLFLEWEDARLDWELGDPCHATPLLYAPSHLLRGKDDDHPDEPEEEGQGVEEAVRVKELGAVLNYLEVVGP